MNPDKWLIAITGALVRLLIRWPRPMATWLIRLYRRSYPIRLDEAANPDITSYANFNEFFTRPLAPGLRVLHRTAAGIYSPVDGTVSQFGSLQEGSLIQAKGINFSARQLCTDAITPIVRGCYITLYLAPADYHRVHMPIDAQLLNSVRIGGETLSVAAPFVEKIDGLYCRNRRMIAQFQTEFGRMVLVMVGARNVSAISTDWHWPAQEDIYRPDQAVPYSAQDEIGRFNLGSTVILLFEFEALWSPAIGIGERVVLAQTIAQAKIESEPSPR